MPKNIVLCCDGTSNQFSYARTNVVQLYSTLVNDPTRQITFYHPGLGTMGPPGALTKFDKWWTKTAGLAFGRGLEDDICSAYCYLMEYFEEGDKVFLFGFSRGAYTVRSLASVLYLYGLIRKGNEPLVPYAIKMMVDIGRSADNEKFELAKQFKSTFSRECKPGFVGVWDTVSSVGWVANPLRLPNTANNPDISVGRHAVAIDERRAFFRSNLWRPRPAPPAGPQDLKQVWFAGSHSDVGGGYAENESHLSKFALEWMLAEARQHGMIVDQSKADFVLGKNGGGMVAPDASQDIHESLTPAWWAAEFWPKKHYDSSTGKTGLHMNLFRRRSMPDGVVIHESVIARGPDYMKRIPVNHSVEPRIPV